MLFVSNSFRLPSHLHISNMLQVSYRIVYFYVLFGASGAGADDWYYKNLTLKIESID